MRAGRRGGHRPLRSTIARTLGHFRRSRKPRAAEVSLFAHPLRGPLRGLSARLSLRRPGAGSAARAAMVTDSARRRAGSVTSALMVTPGRARARRSCHQGLHGDRNGDRGLGICHQWGDGDSRDHQVGPGCRHAGVKGWKRCQGRHRRPQPGPWAGTGRGWRRSAPLMPMEAPPPSWQGCREVLPPATLPPGEGGKSRGAAPLWASPKGAQGVGVRLSTSPFMVTPRRRPRACSVATQDNFSAPGVLRFGDRAGDPLASCHHCSSPLMRECTILTAMLAEYDKTTSARPRGAPSGG